MDIRSILSQPPLFSEMRQQSVVFWKNIELNDMLYWVLNEEMPGWTVEPPVSLAPIELAHLDGLRFPKKRMEWYYGRLTAKKLLKRCHPACFGLSLSEIIILNEPNGKPYACLQDGKKLPGCLSISHRDHYVACGLVLVPNVWVGVDIEKIEARLDSFVKDYFTEAERLFISQLEPEQSAAMITLVWSAKEAVLKALGEGLRQDTRSVDIAVPGGESPHSRNMGWNRFEIATGLPPDGTWQGRWRQKSDYILTLACLKPGEGGVQSCLEINFEEVNIG